ncbi:MAG: hypothetical protein KGJ51_01875 [Acidobacteriota bacterium]|nr:hypothetical protein [Acidobacteriota bacterium]MDE3162979.1 hypothetical protein [Acidobacteriota bacterium]
MAVKSRVPSFDEICASLRSHSFEVTPSSMVPSGVLVAKHGVAAVLAPAMETGAAAQMAIHPGVLVKGEVARLLDRGYQKFIKTHQYELPATAGQLHAIHTFTEELMQLTGEECLYNEALGTTSDLYRYDRLQGRETAQTEPARPWELTAGH